VKFTPVVTVGVVLGASVLAGCQDHMNLEEARALCTKQGGFLVVIYSQKLTASGLGPQIASPGDCISSSNFDIAPPAPASTPAASPAPAPTPAASIKSPTPAN
jgi:hypothetical protein